MDSQMVLQVTVTRTAYEIPGGGRDWLVSISRVERVQDSPGHFRSKVHPRIEFTLGDAHNQGDTAAFDVAAALEGLVRRAVDLEYSHGRAKPFGVHES